MDDLVKIDEMRPERRTSSATCQGGCCYWYSILIALSGSITIFGLIFSPSRRIPDPLHLRSTKLTRVRDMTRFQNCEVLHNKYGDVVRTGKSYTLDSFVIKNAVVVQVTDIFYRFLSYGTLFPSQAKTLYRFGLSAFDTLMIGKANAKPGPSEITLFGTRAFSTKSIAL